MKNHISRALKSLLTTVFVSFAILTNALADNDNVPYNISVLNTINPSPSVEQKCMLIDSCGLLWMGTNSGVKSYDGYRFTSYRSDAKTPDVLPSNSVLSMVEDKENNLWIGTRNGLVCMDKKHGRFTTYHLQGERSREIYALFTSSDGTLWIGTDDGITTFNPETKTFLNYNGKNVTLVEPNGKQRPMPYINAKSFAEDSKGNIYVGTWSKSLYRLESNRCFIHKFDLPTNDNSQKTYMVMLDSHGHLWMNAWGGGIKCLTNPSDFNDPGYIDLYNGDKNTAINYRIIHDPVTHTMWACSRYGIGVLDEENIKAGFKYHKNISSNDKNYALHNVTDICTDGKGNIWAQTFNSGIHHINTQLSPFKTKAILPADAVSNRIKSIFSADGRNFWLTLAPVGIVLYDAVTGKILQNSEIPCMSSVAYSTLSTHMSSIVQATDGSVWFANNSFGVLATKDGKTKLYNSQNCGFVKDNFVKALHRTRSGLMFVGERHHLNWLTPDGQAFGLDDDLDVININDDRRCIITPLKANNDTLMDIYNICMRCYTTV